MSERNDAYNKAKELLESLRKDFHVLFSELSEKDKLIETTHNNLLAALEENKRIVNILKNIFIVGEESFLRSRTKMQESEIQKQARYKWKPFAKSHNIEP